MAVPVYEEQIVCDNCGAVVNSRVVDAAEFERKAEELDPSLSQTDEHAQVIVDDGDLLGEEEDLPVEIIVRHVGTCGRCSESP